MSTWATTVVAETAPVVEVSTALALIFGGLTLFLLRALVKARQEIDRLQAALPPAVVSTPSGDARVDLPPPLQAVLAAAIFMALEGAPAQILSVRAPSGASTWALEGRREVCTSHRVR